MEPAKVKIKSIIRGSQADRQAGTQACRQVGKQAGRQAGKQHIGTMVYKKHLNKVSGYI
jgi:hypothetical protein